METRATIVSATILSTVVGVVPLITRAAEAPEPYRDKAEAAIVVQLPKFCWQQYMDGVSGPGYFIDRKDCGVGMNHYCQGLVELYRARRTFGDRAKRLAHLQVAQRSTQYTISAMKNYPACSIRSHVENTMAEINGYLKRMGRK